MVLEKMSPDMKEEMPYNPTFDLTPEQFASLLFSSTSLQQREQIKIVWRNVILMSTLHLCAIYGGYLMITQAKAATIFAWYFFGLISGMGITAGAHRLWSHRSYEAKWPLRVLLCFLNTMAVQNDIYEWCRDHRVHHKFSETDADPHNSRRGFFFAHVGWLLCKKHPDVLSKGKTVDLSDVWADPVVQFQRRYYRYLILLIAVVLPTAVPVILWKETVYNAFFICVLFRYCYVLNTTWLVNSAAHLWGDKPYDKAICPSENDFVTYNSYGEGYHNYHHTFPWDYSTSELGWKYNWNFSTLFIDFFAWLGWAYNCKKVTADAIERRQERTGDKFYGGSNFRHFEFAENKPAVDLKRCLLSLTVALSHLWVPFVLRFFFKS